MSVLDTESESPELPPGAIDAGEWVDSQRTGGFWAHTADWRDPQSGQSGGHAIEVNGTQYSAGQLENFCINVLGQSTPLSGPTNFYAMKGLSPHEARALAALLADAADRLERARSSQQ